MRHEVDSNSGYYADSDRGYGQRNSPFYKGELNELDVIGIDPQSPIAEEEIQKSLGAKSRITVSKGSSIMLIQSGAMIPDEDMVKGMERYYNVSVFTGVPTERGTAGGAYAKALRLAAAKGGYDKLMVYWGMLETGREDLATKIVSWMAIDANCAVDSDAWQTRAAFAGALPRERPARLSRRYIVVFVLSPYPLQRRELHGKAKQISQ